MATITRRQLKYIKKMYNDGFSAPQLANKLHVSIDAVYYFLRKYNIPRRNARENNLLRFQKTPLTFKIKEQLTYHEQMLKIAGLMLYWTEGTFRGHSVDLANCNPNIIKLFLKFLKIICRVNQRKIRIFLYCYSNQNKEKLITFWSKTIKIPSSQFTKPYVRTDYRVGARQMEYGLVHVRYSDKKLMKYIKDEIGKSLKKVYKIGVGTQVVNEGSL